MNYLDRVKPTYIENWPNSLLNLSFAQVDIPLTMAEARALGLSMLEFGEGFYPKPPGYSEQLEAAATWTARSMVHSFRGGDDPGPQIEAPKINYDLDLLEQQKKVVEDIRCRAADAVSKFRRGAIVRLGSRSPKDAFSWHSEGPKITNGDPLRHVLNASERMYEDLTLALENNYSPHLFVREWVDIEPWAEFRCFYDGGVIGVSQYNYRDHYPECAAYANDFAYWFRYYVNNYFAPACPLRQVVFDLAMFVKQAVEPSGLTCKAFEFKLIEINPFFEGTDPCLFRWSDFDRTYRFVGPDKQTESIPLSR